MDGWGAMFDSSGSFVGEQMDLYGSQPQQTTDYSAEISQKRTAGSYGYDNGSAAKKLKPEYSQDYSQDYTADAPISWDQLGSGPTSWNDIAEQPSQQDEYAQLSEITSWDHISSKPKFTAAPRGGRGGARGFGSGDRGSRGRGGGGGDRGRGGSGDRGRGRGGRGGGRSIGWGSDTDSSGSGQFQDNSGGSGGYGGNKGGNFSRGGGSFGSSGGGGFNKSAGDRGRGRGGAGGRGFSRGGGDRGGGGTSWGSRGGGGGGGGGFGGSGGGFNRNQSLTLIQKFEKFKDFLKRDTARVNNIQCIEMGCNSLGLNLKTDYSVEELPRVYNRAVFSACLKVSGIFLARAVGGNKKELKHEVYNRAYDILTTRTIADINDLSDPGSDLIRACLERQLKMCGTHTFQEGSGQPVNQTVSEIITLVDKSLVGINRLSGGLEKLRQHLQFSNNQPDNVISRLEQGISASKCGIVHMFKNNEIRDAKGGLTHEGEFIVEDTCIARTTGKDKKAVKVETYEMAIEALLNKSVNELIIPVMKDVEEDDEENLMQNEAVVTGVSQGNLDGPPPIVKPSLAEASLLVRMKNLIYYVSQSSYSRNNMFMIDNTITNSGLVALCVYKRPKIDSDLCTSCELYIDNILVAIGRGNSEADCTKDAYDRAYGVISAASPSEIISGPKRLDKSVATAGPLVIRFEEKGALNIYTESNAPALEAEGFDPKNASCSIGDMVILEEPTWATDRKLSAFAILQLTCTMNGIPLEWTYAPVKNPAKKNYKHEAVPVGKYRCQIFLKGEEMADHTGYGKNKTRNHAASIYLYRIYEQRPVLQIVKQDDPSVWIPFVTIKSEADTLERTAGTPTQPDRTFIFEAIRKRIDSSFPSKDGNELVFGPGVSDIDKNQISAYVKSRNIKFEDRCFHGEMYFSIYGRPNLRDIAFALQNKPPGTVIGRYRLIPLDQLPKFSDIVATKPPAVSVPIKQESFTYY
ncbi:uncharacterized protein LOC128223273 [Mya arenaria]|uniref:uncharacterized protein LOC128223273 n=1 Tax=Mya arenaria TaxID=6604 RepID=UPI0022DED68D|nr:uncharacterized protein LOC128223273 [Mya arenaria]